MLTPERLDPIAHAIRNIAFLLMAGMMQAMSSLMGDLSQTLHDAFGGDQKRDVAAEVRQHMTGDQTKMLEEMIAEAKPDSAIQARLLSKLDDETADRLIANLTQESYGLPPLTEELDAPALLAYYQLLESGQEPLTSAVQDFASTMQSLTQPTNRAELQEDMTGRLSSLVGEPVKVEIDKSCGEGIDAMPALDEVVSAYQSIAWTDWKKRGLAKIDFVRVRNVKAVEKVTFRHKPDALEIDACIAEGSAGVVSSSVLSEAIDADITKEAQAAMIAAREKRLITGPEGITLELSGLRVIQPTPGDEQDLRPFGYDGGTSLALTLRRAAGGITTFDSEHSTLRSAVDDKGKDLTQPDDPTSNSSGGFGSFPTIGANGSACLLELNLLGVPSDGASHIALDLDLALELATGVNEFPVQVRFADGAHFKAGTIPFEVVSVESDDSSTSVDLKTNKSLGDLAGVKFTDAKGNDVPVSITSSSTYGSEDDLSEERTLYFQAPVEKGKLTLRMWKGKKSVTVPLKTEVSIGF
ncbi:MAG: hypothetical protein U0527_03000 [Candidatus Eisenbacteria bacterium]